MPQASPRIWQGARVPAVLRQPLVKVLGWPLRVAPPCLRPPQAEAVGDPPTLALGKQVCRAERVFRGCVVRGAGASGSRATPADTQQEDRTQSHSRRALNGPGGGPWPDGQRWVAPVKTTTAPTPPQEPLLLHQKLWDDQRKHLCQVCGIHHRGLESEDQHFLTKGRGCPYLPL